MSATREEDRISTDTGLDNCTVRTPSYIVIAVLNSLTDLGIIILPMPLLFKVKVPL